MTPPPPTLVLFDLDGTLLDTQDAGVRGYEAAGGDIFGVSFSFDGVPLHGKLETENYREAVDRHAPEMNANDHEDRFKDSYEQHMARIGAESAGFQALPGVQNALKELQDIPHVEVGILTGNWERTGRLKLELGNIDHSQFRICSWAEDGESRNDLVPVAEKRFQDHFGCDPEKIVVIGDTPRDIECAHAHGAIAVGVATGIHDADTLRNSGADYVLNDLSTLEPLKALLTGEANR